MPENPSCSTCRWWVPFYEDAGFCQRHAPRLVVTTTGVASSRFPETVGAGFCGEHAAKPPTPTTVGIAVRCRHGREAAWSCYGVPACADCMASVIDATKAEAWAREAPGG